MQVLIVRHAIAEDRIAFAKTGRDDGERPLTAAGRTRMERAAAGLRAVVPELSLIASSPLTRALETATILGKAFGATTVEQVSALSPGGEPEEVVQWLRDHADQTCVALVGHEPDLGELTAFLLLDHVAPFLQFKKGGACLLEFPGPVATGRASLRWLLQPKHLRTLGQGGV